MDSISAVSLAEELGTSVPRVVRAVERLGMEEARGPNGRLRLTKAQRKRLSRHLGVTPRIGGLAQSEVKALAALRAAPLGLASARALASRAGLSPTTASKTLQSLEDKDLVRREKQTIAAGRAHQAQIWLANVLHPDWAGLAAALSRVEPAERKASRRRSTRIPPRLRHLFWDAKPSGLQVDRNGAFIALRLLRLLDPEGLAWGVANLRPSDWRRAGSARGISAPVRALAENLAAAESRR